MRTIRRSCAPRVLAVAALVGVRGPAGAQQLVDAGKEGDGSGGLAFVLHRPARDAHLGGAVLHGPHPAPTDQPRGVTPAESRQAPVVSTVARRAASGPGRVPGARRNARPGVAYRRDARARRMVCRRRHAPHTVAAVLPATTYPNHATFVTGVAADGTRHRRQPCARRRRPIPSRPRGSVRGADDLRRGCWPPASPVRSSSVTRTLVGVMGGTRAGSHWPPGGRCPRRCRDRRRTGTSTTTRRCPVSSRRSAATSTLVVGHLNAPDTAGHVHGPTRRRPVPSTVATDARLGCGARARSNARDDESVVIVVSDHARRPSTCPSPIDLTDALAGTGLTWFPEGSAALVYGTAPRPRRACSVPRPSVAGIDRAGATGVHVVWSTPGRWLCFAGVPDRARHARQPADRLAARRDRRNHPGVRALDARVTGPTASTPRRGRARCLAPPSVLASRNWVSRTVSRRQNRLAARSIVRSMSASVWARLGNIDSNALGARNTPRSSIPWKKRAYASASDAFASS